MQWIGASPFEFEGKSLKPIEKHDQNFSKEEITNSSTQRNKSKEQNFEGQS